MDKERLIYLRRASTLTSDEGMTELFIETLDEIENLEAENEKLKERIENMTLNGLSPESRLAGFSVVTNKQVDRVKELCAENKKLKTANAKSGLLLP